MNPSEFSWKEDQQVTVTNPTPDDFRFKVHNKEYMLEAGRTAKMPGYIAWMYVYNQAVKAAQADDKFSSWNEEGFRQTYFDKFVAGVDNQIQLVEQEPEPEIQTFDNPEETKKQSEAPKRGRPAKV